VVGPSVREQHQNALEEREYAICIFSLLVTKMHVSYALPDGEHFFCCVVHLDSAKRDLQKKKAVLKAYACPITLCVGLSLRGIWKAHSTL
jgi:hypothetical protein